MPVTIVGEFHPTLFANLSEVLYKGERARLLNAEGAALTPAEEPTAPTITAPPAILPLDAVLGDSITLSLGAAAGPPTPEVTWDFMLDGVSIRDNLDESTMTLELTDPGQYLLTVDWSNSEGITPASAGMPVEAAPAPAGIDYATAALAYLDASSPFAGTAQDVTSVSPIGTAGMIFSKIGSGAAIQQDAQGFTFSEGAYLQTQILSGLATTDGLFAVVDLTLANYGSSVGQILDGSGTTVKLRNNNGAVQAVGPVTGNSVLALGEMSYGSRMVIAGELDDILDLLSGHGPSGATVSLSHSGLTDPTPTRFSSGRYVNGTLHRLAIIGRPEGEAWPITMAEVIADFRQGV